MSRSAGRPARGGQALTDCRSRLRAYGALWRAGSPQFPHFAHSRGSRSLRNQSDSTRPGPSCSVRQARTTAIAGIDRKEPPAGRTEADARPALVPQFMHRSAPHAVGNADPVGVSAGPVEARALRAEPDDQARNLCPPRACRTRAIRPGLRRGPRALLGRSVGCSDRAPASWSTASGPMRVVALERATLDFNGCDRVEVLVDLYCERRGVRILHHAHARPLAQWCDQGCSHLNLSAIDREKVVPRRTRRGKPDVTPDCGERFAELAYEVLASDHPEINELRNRLAPRSLGSCGISTPSCSRPLSSLRVSNAPPATWPAPGNRGVRAAAPRPRKRSPLRRPVPG